MKILTCSFSWPFLFYFREINLLSRKESPRHLNQLLAQRKMSPLPFPTTYQDAAFQMRVAMMISKWLTEPKNLTRRWWMMGQSAMMPERKSRRWLTQSTRRHECCFHCALLPTTFFTGRTIRMHKKNGAGGYAS